MVCGKPVMGTYVGGVPEVIANEEMGLLCRPRDAECLASMMVRLACDPGLREHLGRAGRLRCMHMFNSSRMVRECRQLCIRYPLIRGCSIPAWLLYVHIVLPVCG